MMFPGKERGGTVLQNISVTSTQFPGNIRRRDLEGEQRISQFPSVLIFLGAPRSSVDIQYMSQQVTFESWATVVRMVQVRYVYL